MHLFHICTAIITILASAKKYTATRTKSRHERRTLHLLFRLSNNTTFHILVQVLIALPIDVQLLLKLLSAMLLKPVVLKAAAFDTHVAFVVASCTGVHDILTEIGVFLKATSSTEEFVAAVV
jgi:hypothetical protein